VDEVGGLLKLEKLISMIRESAKREVEDLKAILHEELENFAKEKEEEKRREIERLEREFEEEKKKLEKLYSSKKSLFLLQKRSELKARVSEILKSEIEKLLLSLDETSRKKLFEKLFREAAEKVEGDFEVLCPKKDTRILREITGKDPIETDEIEWGFILSKGRMRIVVNIQSVLENLESEIYRVAEEKAGDLR